MPGYTSKAMEQKKRSSHDNSSDSKCDCVGGYEPLAKRWKAGEGADFINDLERGAVLDISSESEPEIEESCEPSMNTHEADKGAIFGTKVTKTGRPSSRQVITTPATYHKSGNDEQRQPSHSISEDPRIFSADYPRTARQCRPSKHAVILKTARHKAKAPLDPTAAYGILAQYVLEMIDDTEPMYDAKLQAETQAALALPNPDYRYKTPHGRVSDLRDRASIRRALELTCIDFCQLRGHPVPQDLLAECHNQSYMSQYRHVQAEFDRVWNGDQPVELYCLPAWTKSFDKWKVPGGSSRGAQLKHGAVYPDGKVSFYGLLDQEKQVAKTKKP